MSEQTEQNSKSDAASRRRANRSAIIIALLSVIIIIQGVKWYLDAQEIKEKDEKIASTEEELAVTMQRMTEISAELDEKIAEIEKLGGNVAELQRAKQEIEDELKRKQRANGRAIKELKDKVEGYEQLLKDKDAEIEKLQSVNKELLTENVSLKTQKNQLGDSISRLTQTKDELENKVAIASHLKAENISILAINDRGKERESPFKSKQISQIKVEFNIAENEVAPIEGKKIMVRIVDQNDQVIFDVARGSGTFMYDGKEEFYTAAQDILYDKTRQKLVYLYEKGSDYESGNYTLEIYTDSYLMGRGEFVVK